MTTAETTAQAATRHEHRPITGIILISVALVVMAGMDAIGKLLAVRIPVIELIFLRHVLYLVFFLPFALWSLGSGFLSTSMPWLQVLRGALMMGSGTLFFAAIARMPIADALTIFFIYPFVVTLAAPLLLGERLGPWRAGAVAAGFLGAVVAIGPGSGVVAPGALLAIGAGICFAGASIATRRIADRDPVLVTIAISGIVATMLSGVAMPFVWVDPEPLDWPLIALMGAIAAGGNAMVILAHKFAAAGLLAPFGYVEIVGAILYGYVIFGDFPSAAVWTGIAIIVASGLVIAWRESRLAAFRRQA